MSLSVSVKVAHSCLTLCDPMDYTVHGILQARILEWVAFPFSRGSSQSRDQTQVSPALQVDSAPAESQGSPQSRETVVIVDKSLLFAKKADIKQLLPVLIIILHCILQGTLLRLLSGSHCTM